VVEPQKARPSRSSIFELMGKLIGGAQERRINQPSVAVLHLDGQIVDGAREMPDMLASGPTVKVIEELEADDNVRAVVARINSPGGSATASEAIRARWRGWRRKSPASFPWQHGRFRRLLDFVRRPACLRRNQRSHRVHRVFALKLSFGRSFKRLRQVESVALV